MKKTIVLSCFLFLCISLKSQNDTQIPNNPKLIKANEKKLAGTQSAQVKVSEYYGLEEQILSLLINKEIPKQLPKSTGISSRTKYVEVLNKWIKENPSFILPEKQNQVITE